MVHYSTRTVCAYAYYCLSCIDAALTMSRMPLINVTHDSDCMLTGRSMKTTADDDMQPVKHTGMSIDQTLIRINGHRHYRELSPRVKDTLKKVGRFDRRRNKKDNDFIRQVWAKLSMIKG